MTDQAHPQIDSIDNLPQPDWQFELNQRFYNSHQRIFVIANARESDEYKRIWQRTKSLDRIGGTKVKRESQLQPDDFQGGLFICGLVRDFTNWDDFGLPIIKIPRGFRFGDCNFTDKDDGILLLNNSATRFVYAGNSLSAIDKLLKFPGGLFQYTIVQKGVPSHFGNLTDNQFDPSKYTDLAKERARYLDRRLESKYFAFHYSPKAPDIETLQQRAVDFDNYVEEINITLALGKPDYKVQVYLYADEKEKLLLSGHPGPSGGWAYGREIHLLGFGSLEHETTHVLFNSAVSAGNSNFFSEGIVQYYLFTTSREKLETAKGIVKKHLKEPIEKWADGSVSFWATPAENKYPVAYPASGLFVKVLIDQHGLAKFKQFYKKTDIETGFMEIYGTPLAKMIDEWKSDDQNW